MRTLTLLLFLCFFIKAEAESYYFSTSTGDDSRSTSEAQNPLTPWKTISKLNDFSKKLDAEDAVFFKRGDVFTGTLIAQSNVTYDAYGIGPKPVITGLATITGWTGLGNGLYEKTLSSFPTNSLNMVLFDGKLQPMGRYPKAGLGENSYFKISSFATSNSHGWANSSGVINSTGIASIPNFVGGELVQRTKQWLFDRASVTAQTSGSVSYNSFVAPGHPSVSYEPVTNTGFFFQNHINCLTRLGEWAYNQNTKKITMYFGGCISNCRS